jgi:hypothetical protein
VNGESSRVNDRLSLVNDRLLSVNKYFLLLFIPGSVEIRKTAQKFRRNGIFIADVDDYLCEFRRNGIKYGVPTELTGEIDDWL